MHGITPTLVSDLIVPAGERKAVRQYSTFSQVLEKSPGSWLPSWFELTLCPPPRFCPAELWPGLG